MAISDYLESLQDDLDTMTTNLELSSGTNFTDIAAATESGEIGKSSSYFDETPTISQYTSLEGWIYKNYFKKMGTLTIPSNKTDLMNLFSNYKLCAYPKVICGNSVTSMKNMYGIGTSESGSGSDKPGQIIDASGLNTSNVTTMQSMFSMLPNLTTVNGIGSWDVRKCTDFSSMFNQCSRVDNLDISNWQFTTTSNINIEQMFGWCSLLKNLSLPSNFVNSKVTSVARLFTFCGLDFKDISVAGWDVSNVTNAINAWASMSYNTEIDFNTLQWKKIANTSGMFSSNTKLTSINPGDFTGSPITDASYMFMGDTKLESADLSKFSPSTSFSAFHMFDQDTKLMFLDLRSLDFSKISDSRGMFGDSNTAVPDSCKIIVADQTAKDWFTTNFSRFTDVETVSEYEASLSA